MTRSIIIAVYKYRSDYQGQGLQDQGSKSKD